MKLDTKHINPQAIDNYLFQLFFKKMFDHKSIESVEPTSVRIFKFQ